MHQLSEGIEFITATGLMHHLRHFRRQGQQSIWGWEARAVAWNCVATETKCPKRDVLTTTKGDKKRTDTLSIERIEPTEETVHGVLSSGSHVLTPTLPPCSPPPPTFSRTTVVTIPTPVPAIPGSTTASPPSDHSPAKSHNSHTGEWYWRW